MKPKQVRKEWTNKTDKPNTLNVCCACAHGVISQSEQNGHYIGSGVLFVISKKKLQWSEMGLNHYDNYIWNILFIIIGYPCHS